MSDDLIAHRQYVIDNRAEAVPPVPPDEQCARCDGEYPGYGPRAECCEACGGYFCGACFRVHEGECCG